VRTVIIDDDPDHRDVVRTLLERAGLGPITEAQDGRTGLRAVEAAAPELVLLDIAMPGPSGLDILEELVRVAPAARIVILSNFPRRLHGETATARGAAGYVEKRVATRDLVREILLAAAITETALEVSAELPAEPSSIRMARTLVRDALGDQGDDVLFALELLVSEVVTNALKHAAGAPRIEAQLTPETIRVAVYDTEPTLPVRRVPDQDRPGGRGLPLLDRVASRWGADSTETGKVVWFELDRASP
jgi:DNA-binding NarL/FixJ family response regulator